MAIHLDPDTEQFVRLQAQVKGLPGPEAYVRELVEADRIRHGEKATAPSSRDALYHAYGESLEGEAAPPLPDWPPIDDEEAAMLAEGAQRWGERDRMIAEESVPSSEAANDNRGGA